MNQAELGCASSDFSSNTRSRFDAGDPADARTAQLHSAAAELKMRPEDLDVFLRNGLDVEQIPKHPAMRRSMVQYLKRNATPPPKWMVASGMFPETHLDAGERRKRIRILYKSVVLIIRRELKRHEVDEFRAERSIFWDPVAEVCQAMEISPSKLSSFCKELTGNSLTQVIDTIRAEGIKRKLRAEIRGFLVQGFGNAPGAGRDDFLPQRNSENAKEGEGVAQCATLGTKNRDKWVVWKALKMSRKWPEFSQNTWAQGLGFSSYRRLYRACQVVYGMTPHQLELALIAECLADEKGDGVIKLGGSGPEFAENTLEEAERNVREIRADEWIEARRE